MTENNHSFVSPDRMSRPAQMDLGINAGLRVAMDAAAVRDILLALDREFAVAPKQVEPVQPAPSRAPAPTTTAQTYLDMPAYQPAANDAPQPQFYGDGASMDTYAQPSGTANDAYLDAIAAPSANDFGQNTGAGQQASPTDERAQRLEAARQDIAGLHDEISGQNNYDPAA